MTGPCAKVRVFCTLVHPDGTGYALCRDVCDQVGHAEVVALAAAGADAAGCTAHVVGRDFVCYDCQEQLVAAGVRRFVLGAP